MRIMKSKKSDKETQSPVLKLFRDMMAREKHQPEKTNLVTIKTEKKKKRPKTSQNSEEKSYSEKTSHKESKKLMQQFQPSRTISTPFRGEKKQSWCVWEDSKKLPSEETCSCASCALKQILSTDCACICCLTLLFVISVIVAFFLVYNSIPCLKEKTRFAYEHVDNDRLKRKTDTSWDNGINSGRKWGEYGVPSHAVPRSIDLGESYEDNMGSLVDSGSELSKIFDSDKMIEIQSSDRLREFYKKLLRTDAQIRELKKDNFLNNKYNMDDKYKIFPDRAKRSLNILQRPFKLFHFRKNKNKTKTTTIKSKKIERPNGVKAKTVDVKAKNKNCTHTKVSNVTKLKEKNQKSPRNKRLGNNSEPEFVIEKKKVVIQFKPNVKRKSKCSHVPKDLKSHENQLKHPFYKNTQRLDELLDKFMDKNLPFLMADQLGLGLAFDNDKSSCKHPKVEENETPIAKNDDLPNILFKSGIRNTMKDEFKNNDADFKKDDDFLNFDDEKISRNDFVKVVKGEASTEQNVIAHLDFEDRKREGKTSSYDLVMSISTMMYDNNNFKRTTSNPLMDRVPNVRRLLQTELDDDEEVLTDVDKVADKDLNKRKKRGGEPTLEDLGNKLKSNPGSIINPNWKGPMPLYPDELNSMIKQEPVIVHRIKTPLHIQDTVADEAPNPENLVHKKDISDTIGNVVNTVENPAPKDSPAESDELEKDLSDTEYIEDYFRNKYDRLVEMAQAYSDYGVLEGKKPDKKVDINVKMENPDRRDKLSFNSLKAGLKNSIFGRPKKEKIGCPEGFKIEVQPTTPVREDDPRELLKSVQKHVKIVPEKCKNNLGKHLKLSNTSDYQGMGLIYYPKIDVNTNNKFDIDIKDLESSVESKTTSKTDDDERSDTDGDDNIMLDNRGKKYTFPNDNNENEFKFSLPKGLRSLKSVNYYSNYDIDEEAAIEAVLTVKNEFDNIGFLKREIGMIHDYAMKFKRDVGKDNDSNDTNSNDTLTTNNVNSMKLATNNLSTDIDMKVVPKEADTDMQLAPSDITVDSASKFAKDVLEDKNELNMSDFFGMLSAWFSTLDGVDIKNHSSIEKASPANISIPKKISKNSTFVLSFPQYDSDMIENIGHRSRVLLSTNVNMNETDNAARDKEMAHVITDPKKDTITLIPKSANKTIVKRNADSNLIFWNDLYDDEYGVAEDNVENKIRDKNSISVPGIKARTNEWFRDKVRKIADGIHRKAVALNHKDVGTLIYEKEKMKNKDVTKKPKHNIKRLSRMADDTPKRAKTDFAVLTANMRKVCRKAAKDIAQTKKVEVREESKQGQAACSLMQQLIRLMNDLVDFQVKQRVCRRLPSDLQNFLEWLTATNPEFDSVKYNSGSADYGDPDTNFNRMNENPMEHTFETPSTSETEKPEARSDCLGTLQAVHELISQFEDMSDDDKSKMTGIKEYLESQLNYLEKLSYSNEFNIYNPELLRFRRDVPQNHQKKNWMLKERFKKIFSKKNNKVMVNKHKNAVRKIKSDYLANNASLDYNTHLEEVLTNDDVDDTNDDKIDTTDEVIRDKITQVDKILDEAKTNVLVDNVKENDFILNKIVRDKTTLKSIPNDDLIIIDSFSSTPDIM